MTTQLNGGETSQRLLLASRRYNAALVLALQDQEMVCKKPSYKELDDMEIFVIIR
jgi:hypothetical protein